MRADPRIDRAWSEAVGELSDSRLAHSPEWFTVIRRAYGHEPLYLRAEDEEGGGGVLPAFIVRRPLLGTVITSMPFLDGGGPCSSSPALAHALIERLMDEARREGAETVELRCTERLGLAWQPTESKVNLMLPLPGEADRLWRQFDGSVRNQIRKAERSGLSVEFGGPEKLAPFYETFAERMRDLGSPVHSEGFLRTVLESCGGRARIALISKGRTIVGGLIALAFKDRLVAPWAACLKDYRSLCPNMLLYWATLRTACGEGFRRFDFGRSSRGSGTYRFKRQWGALEEPLFWYTIPVAPGRHPHGPPKNSKAADLAVKVWQRLPLSVTRQLGPRVRKYLIQ
jgi:FemAB-related protein (PEP-CTERM system-associated)